MSATSALEPMEGLVAILPTPFTEDGRVDEPGLAYLVRAAIDRGLAAVVVLGSNAEFPYLDVEEKARVMAAAVAAANHEVPVIGTASAWSTDQAIELAGEAQRAGCDAVMAALPSYFRLDFKEVVAHYRDLAARSALPVYYYHFPDVTGWSVAPGDLARIAEIDNIIGAKITVINRPFLKKTIQATQPFNWKVFTGSSLLLNDCLDFGGAGAFCPLTLVGAADVKALYEAHRAGDHSRARALQDKILGAIPLFTGSTTAPGLLARGFKVMVRLPKPATNRPLATHGLLKEALRLQGHHITNRVRRPYREVEPDQSELVKRTLTSLGWF